MRTDSNEPDTGSRPRWTVRLWLILACAPISLCCATIAICLIAPAALFSGSDWGFLSITVPWCFLVLSACGAFIARRTAIRIAEIPEFVAGTLTFLRPRFIGLCLAPLLALPIAGSILLLGWLCSGTIETVCSALTTLILAMLLLAWPLMVAGQCVEGTDCFDGFSRGLNFVLSAPIRYLTMLTPLALLCPGFVALVNWFLAQLGLETLTTTLILFPLLAFTTSAFFTWAVVTFVHLREAIDATETDEVFVPTNETPEPIPLSGKVAHPTLPSA